MIKKIAFSSVLLAGLFGGQSSFGQCPTTTPEDFDFWFGVPVWATGYKTPQKIHLTGAGSSSNCYVIDMPADPSFVPISGTLAPGASQTIDMTSFISQIETAPANAVLNRGLRVRVWGEMVGYYADEVGNNYGSIPWKGPNALGTSFIVPGQNIYAQGAYPGAKSQFVITATEDNTVVTITPSEAIVGHGANVPFTITLINADHYEIEWSANQSVFETVATTLAIGAPRHYQTVHHTPLQGNNYYRLKMVDHDQFTEYSDVRVVTLSKGAESFSVSPNPINSGDQTRLTFNLNQQRIVSMQLYNQLGQLVYSKNYHAIAGSNTVLLPIPEKLSAGVYFLSVQDTKGGWSLPKQKIVLNR